MKKLIEKLPFVTWVIITLVFLAIWGIIGWHMSNVTGVAAANGSIPPVTGIIFATGFFLVLSMTVMLVWVFCTRCLSAMFGADRVIPFGTKKFVKI